MRVLWTIVKVALALALVIPVSIIVLATVLSVFGALLGLAILVLKVAVAGVVVWGMFRLLRALMGRGSSRAEVSPVRQLPAADPYYEAAKRELDRELGHATR
ncbi:MAG TPA: hypothetical protein VEB19_09140 [Gemmatimonadaceae bacterium]|nr:hypothetical protein [Gemmatimonadaceae bacterium]